MPRYNKETTATFDINSELHSYYDLPASSDSDPFAKWYSHGKLHRDNDLPALVLKEDTNNQTFFYNGFKHREDDKPAHLDYFSSIWYIMDIKHRINGPAEIKNEIHNDPLDDTGESQIFILYGKHVSFEIFKKILVSSEEAGQPVWFSFLQELQVAPHEEMHQISDIINNEEGFLPVKWVVKALNITDANLAKHYATSTYDQHSSKNSLNAKLDTGTLARFMRVANFESRNNSISMQQGGF